MGLLQDLFGSGSGEHENTTAEQDSGEREENTAEQDQPSRVGLARLDALRRHCPTTAAQLLGVAQAEQRPRALLKVARCCASVAHWADSPKGLSAVRRARQAEVWNAVAISVDEQTSRVERQTGRLGAVVAAAATETAVLEKRRDRLRAERLFHERQLEELQVDIGRALSGIAFERGPAQLKFPLRELMKAGLGPDHIDPDLLALVADGPEVSRT